MGYIGFLVGLWFIYWLAAIGCTYLWRAYGVPVLCAAAIFGLGAYASAIMATNGVPLYVSITAAGVIGALTGLFIGFVISRLPVDIAVVFSIAVQATASLFFLNLTSITGGPMGYSGIPSIVEHGVQFPVLTAIAIIVIVLPLIGVAHGILRHQFTSMAKAAGENPLLLISYGIDPFSVSAGFFCIAFALFGIAGGVFAHYLTYIHPDSFSLTESMVILCMAVWGKRPRVLWAGAGAALLIFVPEILRYVAIDVSTAAKIKGIGLGLVLCSAALILARGVRWSPERQEQPQ